MRLGGTLVDFSAHVSPIKTQPREAKNSSVRAVFTTYGATIAVQTLNAQLTNAWGSGPLAILRIGEPVARFASSGPAKPLGADPKDGPTYDDGLFGSRAFGLTVLRSVGEDRPAETWPGPEMRVVFLRSALCGQRLLF